VHATRGSPFSSPHHSCRASCSRRTLFGTLSSAHFEVKYQRGVPLEDARKVMDYLQTEYRSLAADLGMEPKARIDVRIYESVGKFLEETALKRPWRTAYYQRGTLHLQPVSGDEAEEAL
jgi:hypothetical protein